MHKSSLTRLIDLPWKTTRWTFRKIRLFIKHKLGWLDVPVIVTYRGFRSGSHLFLAGAVMENKGLGKPEKKSSVWQNILAMLKRYSSDQIPGVDVEIFIPDRSYSSVSDENGYFRLSSTMEPAVIQDERSRQLYTVHAEIEDDDSLCEISASSELILPQKKNRFGVISDIDDTILVSYSTQTLKKLRLMLLRNAITRKPFPGISAFYTALHKGYRGDEENPFFYVSSSEWNLYDLLEDFCSFNKFPSGVFMLRELEGSILRSGRGNHEHKLTKIRTVLSAFDTLPFILIGDNGQRDPEIYSKICEEFPGRIIVSYIRNVSGKKTKRTEALKNRMRETGTEMLLVKDTYEAALDAANRKLIAPSAGRDVHREKDRDTEGLLRHLQEGKR